MSKWAVPLNNTEMILYLLREFFLHHLVFGREVTITKLNVKGILSNDFGGYLKGNDLMREEI